MLVGNRRVSRDTTEASRASLKNAAASATLSGDQSVTRKSERCKRMTWIGTQPFSGVEPRIDKGVKDRYLRV